jgi:hypothetical protein
MKEFFGFVAVICMMVGPCGGYSQHKDWLKERASEKWEAQGFEVVDYAGFWWGPNIRGTNYGGAHVYHRLKKIPDNGITYTGSLSRWGNEIMVYGPSACDAIKP